MRQLVEKNRILILSAEITGLAVWIRAAEIRTFGVRETEPGGAEIDAGGVVW